MLNVLGEWVKVVGGWADSAYGNRAGWGGVGGGLRSMFNRSAEPPVSRPPPVRNTPRGHHYGG